MVKSNCVKCSIELNISPDLEVDSEYCIVKIKRSGKKYRFDFCLDCFESFDSKAELEDFLGMQISIKTINMVIFE